MTDFETWDSEKTYAEEVTNIRRMKIRAPFLVTEKGWPGVYQFWAWQGGQWEWLYNAMMVLTPRPHLVTNHRKERREYGKT
jgi:hypothetical protein